MTDPDRLAQESLVREVEAHRASRSRNFQSAKLGARAIALVALADIGLSIGYSPIHQTAYGLISAVSTAVAIALAGGFTLIEETGVIYNSLRLSQLEGQLGISPGAGYYQRDLISHTTRDSGTPRRWSRLAAWMVGLEGGSGITFAAAAIISWTTLTILAAAAVGARVGLTGLPPLEAWGAVAGVTALAFFVMCAISRTIIMSFPRDAIDEAHWAANQPYTKMR